MGRASPAVLSGRPPLALREWALILDVYGKTWKARKVTAQSCSVAELQKTKYELAQSRMVQGRLAKTLGRPEADEQIRTASADDPAVAERRSRDFARPGKKLRTGVPRSVDHMNRIQPTGAQTPGCAATRTT